MTKKELINALEACAVPDDANVVLMNFTKMALAGDGSSEGQHTEFSVEPMNVDLSDDEREYHEETTGFPPEPIVGIIFEDDSDDPEGLLDAFDKEHGI